MYPGARCLAPAVLAVCTGTLYHIRLHVPRASRVTLGIERTRNPQPNTVGLPDSPPDQPLAGKALPRPPRPALHTGTRDNVVLPKA